MSKPQPAVSFGILAGQITIGSVNDNDAIGNRMWSELLTSDTIAQDYSGVCMGADEVVALQLRSTTDTGDLVTAGELDALDCSLGQ